MKYGAVQWCLGKPDGVFDAAKEVGLDGVELGYGEPGDLTTDPSRRSETLAKAEAAGVAVPSLMLGSLNRGGWAQPSEELASQAMALVRGSFVAARELGAKVILVPFFFDAHPKDDGDLHRLVEGFQRVADDAGAAGLTLAYEGELPADRVAEVIERIDSPYVRCYYDVGNAVWLGHDPLAEIRLLGDLICQVHFKEFDQKLSDKLLGEGKVPVAEACDALREIGYDGWAVLETGTFKDPVGNTRKQLDYLKQFA